MAQSGASKIGKRALEPARQELKAGVREHPAGSNWSPRIKQYLASAGLHYPKPPGAPWCMAFVHWCFAQVGRVLGGGASVGNFEGWAAENGDIVRRPFAGDIACYDWDGGGWPDHVGIVERVLALPRGGRAFTVLTIEGNTAVGNDSNGGKVMRRVRAVRNCKFVRIPDR